MPHSTLHNRANLVPLDVDGISLEIKTFYLKSKRPGARGRFLLLHGNPSHMGTWENTVDSVSQLGDIIAYDAPGFGRSRSPKDCPRDLNFLSNIAARLALHFGWNESWDVIGHSHGAAVAQTLAARMPERVRTLVLIGSAGYPAHFLYRVMARPRIPDFLYTIGQLVVKKRLVPVHKALVGAGALYTFHPDPVPDGFKHAEWEIHSAHPEILHSMAKVTEGDPCAQLMQQANRIRSPMLVLHGSRDALVPLSSIEALVNEWKRNSKVTYQVLEGAGHMMHVARSGEVNEKLTAWLTAELEPKKRP